MIYHSLAQTETKPNRASQRTAQMIMSDPMHSFGHPEDQLNGRALRGHKLRFNYVYMTIWRSCSASCLIGVLGALWCRDRCRIALYTTIILFDIIRPKFTYYPASIVIKIILIDLLILACYKRRQLDQIFLFRVVQFVVFFSLVFPSLVGARGRARSLSILLVFLLLRFKVSQNQRLW